MNLLTLDFESYWDTEYTLSKMTTESYVRDQRFHAFLVGLRWNAEPPFWIPHEQIPEYFAQIDWPNTAVLCHHAHFDGLILSHHYGVVPGFWLDTLSMGRGLYPATSVSLASLAKRLLNREKGKEVMETRGKRHLTDRELQVLGDYCANNPNSDINLTYALFLKMKDRFPQSELRVIDMVIRQFTEPCLLLNQELLQEVVEEERVAKQLLLDRIGHDQELLSSSDQFARLLYDRGVEPPMKLSPAALKRGDKVMVWAFSKADEEFLALKEHDDPVVVALVEARLGVKSTLKATRSQRLLGISTRGAWPVYYYYYGGHTGRFSGGDKINAQNFTRGSKIRESVEAPPGCVLVVKDSAQIEARVVACLAGQQSIVDAFAQNRDVYSEMASTIFGRRVDRKRVKDDFIPGFIGKSVVLGCGFGMGWQKFQGMIRIGMLGMRGILFDEAMLAALGLSGQSCMDMHNRYSTRVFESLPKGMDYVTHLRHCTAAKHIIDTYRRNNPQIVNLWSAAQRALQFMLDGDTVFTFGTSPQLTTGPACIHLPNGMNLSYPDFGMDRKGEYYCKTRSKTGRIETSKLYGGKIVENCVQALARIVITNAMDAMRSEGMRVVLHTHDEAVVCCRETEAEEVSTRMDELMVVPPAWAPNLPLGCEGGWARNYSK